MSTAYDAIVIGGGPAGEHCAGHLADGGLKVALVERELVGGECDYWACIPSKTLLRPGEALQAAREAPGAAQAVTASVDPEASSSGATSWSRTTTTPAKAAWLEDKGIDVLRGAGGSPGPGRSRSTAPPTRPRTS